jgi:hypothetical protein
MALFVPTDGRLTSQNLLNLPLTGGEVMYIVSPGNAALGNSYQVTVATLAAFMAAFPKLNYELLTSGATLAHPYNVLNTDTGVLFDKTIGSASYAVLPAAGSMQFPLGVLFKDIKGDAATNNITITFSGGQLCDGLSSVEISNPYGWVNIYPLPTGSGWYMAG